MQDESRKTLLDLILGHEDKKVNILALYKDILNNQENLIKRLKLHSINIIKHYVESYPKTEGVKIYDNNLGNKIIPILFRELTFDDLYVNTEVELDYVSKIIVVKVNFDNICKIIDLNLPILLDNVNYTQVCSISFDTFTSNNNNTLILTNKSGDMNG